MIVNNTYIFIKILGVRIMIYMDNSATSPVKEEVFNAMNELRAVGDEMEVSTAADYWPYPSYGELLYGVR